MSGVPVHTQSPINLAKASGITPQTAYAPPPNFTETTTTTTTTATPSYPSARPGKVAPAPTATPSYPSAKPGEVAPTPTATRASNPYYEPAAPQPGSVPSPSTARATSRPSLPPPPKAGELPRPSEYYTTPQALPTNSARPIPYPEQMMLTTPEASKGQPQSSTTSTNFSPSIPPSTALKSPPKAGPTFLNPSHTFNGGSNLEHPPGYVQNPHASEMTPDQRFATEQADRSGNSQAFGHNKSMATNNASFEDDDSVWGIAKKWAKGAGDTVGGYVTEMNEKLSQNLDNKK